MFFVWITCVLDLPMLNIFLMHWPAVCFIYTHTHTGWAKKVSPYWSVGAYFLAHPCLMAFCWLSACCGRGVTKVINKSKNISDVPQWFEGCRLNYAENLLRHRDDKVALYGLREYVCNRHFCIKNCSSCLFFSPKFALVPVSWKRAQSTWNLNTVCRMVSICRSVSY